MPINDLPSIRRRNVLALYQQFAAERLAKNPHALGLERDFAKSLEISPSTWSMMKGGTDGARPIGDKIARQVEQHAGKPHGWLDEPHDDQCQADPAEEHFLELAQRAWRSTTAKGRRELLRAVKAASAPIAKD